jgi:hypothetical protein
MSKPDAPTPPNPYQTAAAQTGTNVSTGVANAFLNNINQSTPDGSLSYDVTGNYSWADPSTGHTYSIPRFTSTQTLSPQGQALQNTTNATKQSLATMGLNQANRASDLLSTPFNPSTYAPQGGDTSWLSSTGFAQTGYDSGGAIQSTFGDAGDITRDYGPADGFSADRQRVEDALMARMNPQLQRERGNIEQRLADQGIRYGSQAYTSAMDDYNRQANDARFAAVGQGGQEQQRMMDMEAQRAGFKNSAQQQAYEQAQGRGTFANLAQNQRNNQNASQAGFYNAGTAQNLARNQSVFNAANTQRNQYMQEQYAQRNQPLNEISALMSGSAVQSPNWLNSPNSQIATTDIGGLINQNFAQNQANYQSANSNWQSMMGGILGLGAGLIKSDRDEKKNIERVGTVFAYDEDAERKKLPIYEYEYKKASDGRGRRVGPMAQDVEKIDRGAVRKIDGVRHIEPARVMGNILRAA